MSHKKSRPVNWFRENNHPVYRSALTAILAELAGKEARSRGRGATTIDFERTVSALVLDLCAALLTDPQMVVAISRENSIYVKPSRYRPAFVTWSLFDAAFRGLQQTDYIVVTSKGFHNKGSEPGRLTRIAGTAKLANMLAGALDAISAATTFDPSAMQTVILRDENKQQIHYRDNNAIRLMRANLQALNTTFQKHWFDVWVSDAEFAEMNLRLTSKLDVREDQSFDPDYQPPINIDFSRRAIVRIFNNKDWAQGGRFYGGWWQVVPKKYRPFITIDGKKTVELDFSHLHPALLYAEEGLLLDGDAYDIGLQSVKRDIIKRTFNAMVNARKQLNPVEGFDSKSFGISWEQLQMRIIARHEPIKRYFKSGYGLYLQRKDADLAERIMLRFAKMGYPCLPIHDSFIVHHALEDELQLAMQLEFYEQTGLGIKTKAKKHDYDNFPTGYLDTSNPNLEPTGPYTGYDKRLLAYLNTKAGC